ncbi:MAG: uroporphyrinogen-III synthase [Bacteroidaceae bacterium]|nr:uroporphyrinogen-III synthase [Bacteroidaceae bacterium]
MIRKILVSQPKPASEKSPYYALAEQNKVEIVFRPFIKVVGITETEFRAQRINLLDYTAVVFTSRHSIDNYFKMAKASRINIPESMKYFCVTETISLYIQKYVQYRKRKIFFGTTGKLIDLIPLMVKHKTEKYLIPVSDVHSDDINKTFDAEGLHHKECVMYRTVSNNFSKGEVFDYDMVVLFSPTGVNTLISDFPDIAEKKIKIATFGPATAKTAEDAGLNLVVKAPSSEYPSMTAALQKYLEKEQTK